MDSERFRDSGRPPVPLRAVTDIAEPWLSQSDGSGIFTCKVPILGADARGILSAGDDMENWFVSVMRLSTAMTFFGAEQVQKASEALKDEHGMERAADNMSKAIDSIAEAMISEMGHENREAVESVVEASRKVLHQMADSATIDPSDFVRASGEIMQRASKDMTSWLNSTTSKGESTDADDDDPKPGDEVL